MSDSRLFKILYYLLDRKRATAPELAAEFEVSTRTIYRDMEALSSAGIPVYAEPGRNGGIYLLQDFILDRAILSENEKQEVLTAIQSMAATGYTSGKEMLTKLSALFNVNTRNYWKIYLYQGHTRKQKTICNRHIHRMSFCFQKKLHIVSMMNLTGQKWNIKKTAI